MKFEGGIGLYICKHHCCHGNIDCFFFSMQQREAAGLKLLFLHKNVLNSLFNTHYFYTFFFTISY